MNGHIIRKDIQMANTDTNNAQPHYLERKCQRKPQGDTTLHPPERPTWKRLTIWGTGDAESKWKPTVAHGSGYGRVALQNHTLLRSHTRTLGGNDSFPLCEHTPAQHTHLTRWAVLQQEACSRTGARFSMLYLDKDFFLMFIYF